MKSLVFSTLGLGPTKEQRQRGQELLRAVKNQSTDFSYELLQAQNRVKDKDVDLIRDENNCTALMIACQKGYMGTVLDLLKKGANPDLPDKNGDTAFTTAVIFGHADISLKLLDKGANINATNKDGNSAAMRSVVRNDYGMVKELAERGADLNIVNNNRETALTMAVERSMALAVSTLINNRADVNVMDRSGATPLINATLMGSVDMVAELLQHPETNIDIEISNPNSKNYGSKAIDIARRKRDELITDNINNNNPQLVRNNNLKSERYQNITLAIEARKQANQSLENGQEAVLMSSGMILEGTAEAEIKVSLPMATVVTDDSCIKDIRPSAPKPNDAMLAEIGWSKISDLASPVIASAPLMKDHEKADLANVNEQKISSLDYESKVGASSVNNEQKVSASAPPLPPMEAAADLANGGWSAMSTKAASSNAGASAPVATDNLVPEPEKKISSDVVDNTAVAASNPQENVKVEAVVAAIDTSSWPIVPTAPVVPNDEVRVVTTKPVAGPKKNLTPSL